MKLLKDIKKKPRLLAYLIMAGCAAAGITLLILPADYFDTGQAMCLSVLIADVECYGCGMTRAIQHMIHFEFEEAWMFNKLSFIVAPLSIYMIGWEVKKLFDQDKMQKSEGGESHREEKV